MFLEHQDHSLWAKTLIKGLMKNGSIYICKSLSLRYLVQGSIPLSKDYSKGSDPLEPKIYFRGLIHIISPFAPKEVKEAGQIFTPVRQKRFWLRQGAQEVTILDQDPGLMISVVRLKQFRT